MVDQRHVLDKTAFDPTALPNEGLCQYLGVPKECNYPFRLVFFKEEPGDTGLYEAHITPQTHTDMGFAIRGWYPIVNELGNNQFGLTRDRRNSFFGIINAQEIFQPHELDFDEIEGVEVCENDGKIFMQKGELLRLPLKGIYPFINCTCNCGNKYNATASFNTTNSGVNEGVPSIFQPMLDDLVEGGLPIGWKGWTWSWSFSSDPTPFPDLRIDTWAYTSSVIIAIYSPQYTNWCPLHSPPVFTHPYCSQYEMGELYWASASRYTGAHTFFRPNETGTIWSVDSGIQGPNSLNKIGEFCYLSNKAVEISDMNISTFSGVSVQWVAPPVPTEEDFSDLEEDGHFPPEWIDWDLSTSVLNISAGIPGIFQECDPCVCSVPPPSYITSC